MRRGSEEASHLCVHVLVLSIYSDLENETVIESVYVHLNIPVKQLCANVCVFACAEGGHGVDFWFYMRGLVCVCVCVCGSDGVSVLNCSVLWR